MLKNFSYRGILRPQGKEGSKGNCGKFHQKGKECSQLRILNLPWKQISIAPTPTDKPWWENFSKKIWHLCPKYFWRKGLKCVFSSQIFHFTPNVDRNFTFFYIKILESQKNFKNFFFNFWAIFRWIVTI